MGSSQETKLMMQNVSEAIESGNEDQGTAYDEVEKDEI